MSKARIAFIFTHRIQYFVNLLDEIQKTGKIEVIAIYARENKSICDPGFLRNIDWENRKVVDYQEVVLLNYFTQAKNYFWDSWSKNLEEVLNNFNPDVIHIPAYASVIYWQAYFWAIRKGVPYVLRGDGDNLGKKKVWKSLFRRALVRPLVMGAAKVFYQGEQNKEFWIDNGALAKQLVWVPCVPDSQIFRKNTFLDEASRVDFRVRHGADPRDVIFIISGKLESRKRPKDAIEALEKLQNLPIRLWFIGSGPLEKELKSLAEHLGVTKKIFWWGFRNQTEIPQILQAGDVLLHLSELDPWPYAVLEGAISGLALLLSDRTASHPEWMPEPSSGMIFRCGDIMDLSKCIEFIVSQRSILQSYKINARQKSDIYIEDNYAKILEKAIT